MACERYRGYGVPFSEMIDQGRYGRNEGMGRGCPPYAEGDPEWMPAMLPSPRDSCRQNEEYRPMDHGDGREKYLMDVLGMLLTLLHHRHHE